MQDEQDQTEEKPNFDWIDEDTTRSEVRRFQRKIEACNCGRCSECCD